MRFVAFILVAVCMTVAHAAEIHWQSATTSGEVKGTLVAPATHPAGPIATVVYLKNLSIPRLGRDTDDAIIADLIKQGMQVLVLDYAKHAKANSPDLTADLLKLRRDMTDAKAKSLLADENVDANHLFIIPEGFNLKRDIEFARDGKRILAMDVIYPANPEKPIPALMEITCDNKDRMGSSSLLFCHDTLFEGAALAGFASAMIDHPIPAPYKGIDDPIAPSIDRMKAAAKTLRELGPQYGMTGKIGVMGFSRGATMAAILAAPGQTDVQAALIHGNRFDYLDLLPNDPMLARFEKAWGKRDEHQDRWAEHGAAHYLTKNAAPMFLNTSDTESPEYRDGLEKFANRLKSLGVKYEYQLDADGRGHRVSTDPQTLAAIYAFFHKHLD